MNVRIILYLYDAYGWILAAAQVLYRCFYHFIVFPQRQIKM